MEDKWIEFIEIFDIEKTSRKTKIFSVKSKCSGCELGVIKWYTKWRHYCFFPTTKISTVHSDRCLLLISNFITKLSMDYTTKLNMEHLRGI